jgi:hypothetical protein
MKDIITFVLENYSQFNYTGSKMKIQAFNEIFLNEHNKLFAVRFDRELLDEFAKAFDQWQDEI